MRERSLSHLPDDVLLRDTARLIDRDHENTAELLLHLAEVDARRLFLRAGYPFMHAFCVDRWHMSDDAAYKRLHAARTGRDFPAVFDAVAEGRLHLTAVVLLAPHLTPMNAEELLNAATHKTVGEIKEMLAQRFPRTESLPLVTQVPSSPVVEQDANVQDMSAPLVSKPADVTSVSQSINEPRPKVEPVAPERYLLQLTMSRQMRDKLQHAQNLMSHQGSDVPGVLERALDALIANLEKHKLGATEKPQAEPRPAMARRTIPAAVRRAVWQRDGGQCAFVSESGRRCASRWRLEYDHTIPLARGGEATVDGVRLLCRAHNQYLAERALGAEFMKTKRHETRRAVH